MDEARDESGVVIPFHEDVPRRGSARRFNGRRLGGRLDATTEATAEVYRLAPATAQAQPAEPDHVQLGPRGWEDRAVEALTFLRQRLSGHYELDDYGFDADLTDAVVLPMLRGLYSTWFRVDVHGIEHVPSSGGALLVANHSSGLLPLDAAMTAVAVHDEHPAHRHLRMLGDQRVFSTPGLGVLARRIGVTLACEADASRLLGDGELVGTWPEGFAGIAKPYRERYQLRRFARGGFVASAIAAGVPIIPVSIVGAEEIHPVLGTLNPLARLLDVPYFPLTPTFPWLGPLGLVPLPSKWYIEFGAPIDTTDFAGTADAASADSPAIFEVTDQVRETIQSTLHRLLAQRRSPWR